MRQITKSITNPIAVFTIRYPNSVAFMYSPQRVEVHRAAVGAGGSANVIVTHTASGRSYTEKRGFFNDVAAFDISRIMQLLAPDVDQLFQRLDYKTGQSLTEAFTLQIEYIAPDGTTQTLHTVDDITALYGTLDQGEIYGEHTQRRLWVNYPQTFNLWTDVIGDTAFVLDDAYIYPDTAGDGPCYECDFIGTLETLEDTETLGEILPGHPMRFVGLTWKKRIEEGQETSDEFRLVTLVPDYCKPGKGTYLRWLNRRGEVSYWLFKNSQIRTTSVVNNSFKRFYDNDPSVPVAGSYINEQKSDYREARELVLGAVGLSRDEYEDLCDLATSPLVERLLSDVPDEDTAVDVIYDGGYSTTTSDIISESGSNQDSEVDGGNAKTGNRLQAPHVWQRVNVAAGTYARNIRRQTPSRQDLEFIIELPERNTVKL